MRFGLEGDGFGELGVVRGDAAVQEAAGGEELGVEQGGAGGAADEVVGEQGQLDVKERTFADAADDGGHAAAGVDVAAGVGSEASSASTSKVRRASRTSSSEAIFFRPMETHSRWPSRTATRLQCALRPRPAFTKRGPS